MKKVIALLLALVMLLALAGCGQPAAQPAPSEAPAAEPAATPAPAETPDAQPAAQYTYRIAGLKGPTTMGLVNLMAKAEAGQAQQDYQFSVHGAADEIVPLLVKGELDIAAVPANLAATLYQKTQGGVQAVAVNTLGVLYLVTTGDDITSLEDLKGATVLSTGKGTTPEYVFRHLLEKNGLDPDKDLTIEYKSEATEVLAAMQADSGYTIALLPQPYVTAAQMQLEGLKVALSLTEEWDKVEDTPLVTGVTLVRKQFLEDNPGCMEAFMADYQASVEAVSSDLEGTAALCEQYGIVAKAPIAKKALPACNIVFMAGEEMEDTLENYLEVLYEADPASVGGQLPQDDFYFGAD